MSYSRLWQSAAVCLLAVSLLPLAPAPGGRAQSVTYTVTDLGTLGGSQSKALGLDNCGRVVGESNPTGSGATRPFIWSDGQMTDINASEGREGTAAAVVNGTAVGTTRTSTGAQLPFIWTAAGGKTTFNPFGGSFGAAFDINDSNKVVGVAEESVSRDRGFVWQQSAAVQTVQPFSGGSSSAAYGINNAGKVVGTAQISSGATHAFVLSGGVMTDLGTLGGGDSTQVSSYAFEINDSDQVVGYSFLPSDSAARNFRAFLATTSAGSMTDLGTLGGSNSIAYDVNSSGQVVGMAQNGSNLSRAFLRSSAGVMQDLNDLAPGTGWTFQEARAVNDRGQIVGTGTNPGGQTHAFLLTPSNAGPSPCAQATPTPTPTATPDPATLQFSADTYSVGELGPKVTITVTRTGDTSGVASVNYATSDGTATAGSDYAAASGTLNFAAGETSKNISVSVVGDTTDEPNENFFVNLSSATNATISDNQAEGTIQDDDGPPSLSISDVTVDEDKAGTTTATFTVTLLPASGQTVTVNYATAGGTATAGPDYTSASGKLTFSPGDTSETISVTFNDDAMDEPDETFFVNLSDATNATISDGQGVGTIKDDDGAPGLSINDVMALEGDAGTTNVTFTVTLLPASGQTVTVDYATADGTATAGSDYAAPTPGTLTFAPGETSKTVGVAVAGDTADEPDETFFVNLSNASNAAVSDAQGVGTISNDDSPVLQFTQAGYPASEGAHLVTVTVARSGDLSVPVAVDYATSDGSAEERRDYTAALGTLRFAAGDASESFDVLITDDAYTESAGETVNLTLSNPAGGAFLGARHTAEVLIEADDNPPPASNTIDDDENFVRQHYHDFLNREPDASGLAHWKNQMRNCSNPPPADLLICRINVSAAFFLSIEFQQTGYLVYKTYKAAFGDFTEPSTGLAVPVVRLREFLPDTQRIGRGVVVGPPGWEQQLDANKNAYMEEFVTRPRFLSLYPRGMAAAEFVAALDRNAGGVLGDDERARLASELAGNNTDSGRAAVLRGVAENAGFDRRERNRAFVLMQYFGYLRRNPDDAPERDRNFGGWKFWLDKLNHFDGNFVRAEMVKAFIESIEYRQRFAP